MARPLNVVMNGWSKGSGMLISNSLILLLAFTRAELNRNHDYRRECWSILKGIKEYTKEFTIVHGDIDKFYQIYHENIVLTNNGIEYETRDSLHEINSFEQYYSAIKRAITRIKNNYESPKRTIRLSAFTTLSSGYDSTAVSSIV